MARRGKKKVQISQQKAIEVAAFMNLAQERLRTVDAVTRSLPDDTHSPDFIEGWKQAMVIVKHGLEGRLALKAQNETGPTASGTEETEPPAPADQSPDPGTDSGDQGAVVEGAESPVAADSH